MQLVIIKKDIPQGVSFPEYLSYPLIIVDERDFSIKYKENVDSDVVVLSRFDKDSRMVSYAHRKRFGIVSVDVLDTDVVAPDVNLTMAELENLKG